MSEPKPGAGLPFCERIFIKYIGVSCARVFLSWDNSLKLFQKESLKIKELIKDIPQEKLQQRVKIDRVFGIEDHSCNYSINMTLEHLSIVITAMIFLIDSLSKENVIEKEVKIEEVKPSQNGNDEDKKFFQSVDKYVSFIEKHPKNISKATKSHPWFVEFNNKDWATFCFIHTAVHRRQIEAIIKKLNS